MLLELTQAGMNREDAYEAVQRNAMEVWQNGGDFQAKLEVDANISAYLDATAIAGLFDLGHHTKHVDAIFERVFG